MNALYSSSPRLFSPLESFIGVEALKIEFYVEACALSIHWKFKLPLALLD
jgi:hypothetical protein